MLSGIKWTEEDEFNFKQKAAAINQGMHGIYNKADRSTIQKLAVGRLAMLYRKWIRPNYMKRFKAARYNMDLGQWTQGYYNTAFGFIYTLMKDLRRMQFHLAAHYQELTKEEKYICTANEKTGRYGCVVYESERDFYGLFHIQ
jgi:hypothetical protein